MEFTINQTTGFDLTAGDPTLVGTGTERAVVTTVNGTATHFAAADGLHTLCGAVSALNTDAADWVSCTRCMGSARKAAQA